MTIITHEIRMQQYSASDPKQMYLASNVNEAQKLILMAKKYDLSAPENYKKFATTVGDIILGFYRTEDTVPLLQQELGIDATTAGLLGADVLEFLAPLSDPNFIVPEEESDEELEELTMPAQAPAPTTHSSATFYIPPTNGSIPVTAATPTPTAEIPHMPEIRTMAGDMARSPERTSYEPVTDTETPVYSSEQPPVRTPLSDLPAYTASPDTKPSVAPTASIETPRWGA